MMKPYHCYVLKSEEGSILEGRFEVRFFHEDDILDSNPKLPREVETRFCSYNYFEWMVSAWLVNQAYRWS